MKFCRECGTWYECDHGQPSFQEIPKVRDKVSLEIVLDAAERSLIGMKSADRLMLITAIENFRPLSEWHPKKRDIKRALCRESWRV